MSPPDLEPIGLRVTRTAKVLSRAFDDTLAEVGGSLPAWLVLVSLKGQRHGMQRQIAEAVGIEGPTLTHHLNRMEASGLVTRRRDPDNRRVHQVELTGEGDALFHRLLESVTAFDRQLRAGLTDQEVAVLSGLLTRLRDNAAGPTGAPASRETNTHERTMARADALGFAGPDPAGRCLPTRPRFETPSSTGGSCSP